MMPIKMISAARTLRLPLGFRSSSRLSHKRFLEKG